MDNPENIYLPIFVDLTGKLVVVVGGGMVAARKVESLVKAGAIVKVIAPVVVDEIVQYPDVRIELREYEEDDLEGAFLVIAATDNDKTNRAVSEEALDRRIFCNVVDRPDLCSFIVPSVVERGPIKVASSSARMAAKRVTTTASTTRLRNSVRDEDPRALSTAST